MANIMDFRDFEAFKACRGFVREVGLLIRSGHIRRDRCLRDQMERASISVLSNFAEGFERDGNAEFIQFLTVSKGSVGELRAQLIYCVDLELIEESKYEALDSMGESVARLLGGLIRYLKASDKQGRKYEGRSSSGQTKTRHKTYIRPSVKSDSKPIRSVNANLKLTS
jgi:four helix bundle protein